MVPLSQIVSRRFPGTTESRNWGISFGTTTDNQFRIFCIHKETGRRGVEKENPHRFIAFTEKSDSRGNREWGKLYLLRDVSFKVPKPQPVGKKEHLLKKSYISDKRRCCPLVATIGPSMSAWPKSGDTRGGKNTKKARSTE